MPPLTMSPLTIRGVLIAAICVGTLACAPTATAAPDQPPPEAGGTSAAGGNSGARHAEDLVVSPTPQRLSDLGGSVPLTSRVRLVVGPDTDHAAEVALTDLLRSHGVRRVDRVDPGFGRASRGLLTIHLGDAGRADVAAGLRGTTVPNADEGYALRADTRRGAKTVAIGGIDGSGQFYGVQTLRQLLKRDRHGWQVGKVSVTDWPAMPLRGTIEGFYGQPWTPAERLDQMDFYQLVKVSV